MKTCQVSTLTKAIILVFWFSLSFWFLNFKIKQLTRMKTYQVSTLTKALDFINAYDFSSQGPLYCLFMSGLQEESTSPNTPAYWCPDCVVAHAPVYQAFENANNDRTLLEIQVGEYAEWKKQDNDFRTNPMFQIHSVPTLGQWTREGPVNREQLLIEESCTDPELLRNLFTH